MQLEQQNKLKSLLQAELACFKEILSETQAFQENFNNNTTDALLGLLDEREVRINLINRLEIEREKIKLCDNDYNPIIKTIEKDIKEIALNLVRIDAELLDILSMSKESIIKEISFNNADINKSKTNQNHKRPRFLDILQK